MAELLLGIDLGGTAVKSAVVTREREVLAHDSRATEADRGEDHVIEVMSASATAALETAKAELKDVMAAGIGAPGPMDWRTGVVYSPPNLPGWKNVPLAERMRERLHVPCYVDNDANLACYGEFWMGAGQGTENMCVLTLGTGVGGGIVTHGKLLRGIDGTAAEIGHLKVARTGRRCGCGDEGCLEAYASVTGMLRTAWEGIESGRETSLRARCDEEPGRLTGAMVSEEADAGDAFAVEVIRETADWLGMGIAGLINLLNPEKVVLCGGMVQAGPLLLDRIRETARRRAFEVPGRRAEIVTGALGSDSGVIGAAGAALDRLESEGF
jgi:glucokinase